MAPTEDTNDVGGGRRNPTQRRAKLIKDKLINGLQVTLTFNVILHVAMIIIAAINLKRCPVEPKIPQILLAEGIIGLVTKLIGIFRNHIIRYVNPTEVLSVLSTIHLVLLIAGSYYTFKEYKPSYDLTSDQHYCNKTVYLFSLIYISVTYALIALMVFGVCCFVSTICVLEKCATGEDEHSVEEARQLNTTANK